MFVSVNHVSICLTSFLDYSRIFESGHTSCMSIFGPLRFNVTPQGMSLTQQPVVVIQTFKMNSWL
jgi:hypothetical protein